MWNSSPGLTSFLAFFLFHLVKMASEDKAKDA
jgi:hypothetical protein